MAVTVGQLQDLIEGLPAVAKAFQGTGLQLADLPADAALTEDVLGLISIFWPPASLFEIGLAVSVCVGEYVVTHAKPLPTLHITPDVDPEVDANAYPGRRE